LDSEVARVVWCSLLPHLIIDSIILYDQQANIYGSSKQGRAEWLSGGDRVKTAPEHEPEVIRVQEFAQRLQISVWTARQWAYRGKIASCKAGKHLLIPASEISRLIAQNTRPALDARP
jgi:excisionase family DNA binding protein